MRESWALRAAPAYYIGPDLRHYRCYRVRITETNIKWISDTIAWFPHYTNLTIYTNQTTLSSAAHELTQSFLQIRISSSFSPLSNSHFKSLLELREILKHSIPVDVIAPSPDDIANADDEIG